MVADNDGLANTCWTDEGVFSFSIPLQKAHLYVEAVWGISEKEKCRSRKSGTENLSCGHIRKLLVGTASFSAYQISSDGNRWSAEVCSAQVRQYASVTVTSPAIHIRKAEPRSNLLHNLVYDVDVVAAIMTLAGALI